jgi:hypothetical protein
MIRPLVLITILDLINSGHGQKNRNKNKEKFIQNDISNNYEYEIVEEDPDNPIHALQAKFDMLMG